jgi:SP family facilitated glucose transporter-like MFS transporter 8
MIFSSLFYFMPESPHYLITKSKNEKAVQSLKWFRNDTTKIQEEIKILQAEEKERQEMNQHRSFRELLKDRANRKSLIIVLSVGMFVETSGIDIITFYNTQIFAEAKTSLSPMVQSLVVALMQLLMGFVTAVTVERLGRKILLIGSTILMCFSLGGVGLHFYLKDVYGDIGINLDWLPLTSLIVYVCAFGAGLGPVIFILFSEMCGSDIKDLAVGAANSVLWFSAFMVTKYFTNLVHLLGTGQTFWLFSLFNLLAAIFIYFMVPETKGKSLSEIQEKLAR